MRILFFNFFNDTFQVLFFLKIQFFPNKTLVKSFSYFLRENSQFVKRFQLMRCESRQNRVKPKDIIPRNIKFQITNRKCIVLI